MFGHLGYPNNFSPIPSNNMYPQNMYLQNMLHQNILRSFPNAPPFVNPNIPFYFGHLQHPQLAPPNNQNQQANVQYNSRTRNAPSQALLQIDLTNESSDLSLQNAQQHQPSTHDSPYIAPQLSSAPQLCSAPQLSFAPQLSSAPQETASSKWHLFLKIDVWDLPRLFWQKDDPKLKVLCTRFQSKSYETLAKVERPPGVSEKAACNPRNTGKFEFIVKGNKTKGEKLFTEVLECSAGRIGKRKTTTKNEEVTKKKQTYSHPCSGGGGCCFGVKIVIFDSDVGDKTFISCKR